MKVIALLPWFDERPDWLSAAVASCSLFCDHIVALDGAYLLYPNGRGSSPLGQADAILETARGCGMGVTVEVPKEKWVGNEIEKRNRLLELGRGLAGEDDWFFWIDADMVVRNTPGDLRRRLGETDRLVGHVSLWQSVHPDETLADSEEWHEIDRQHPLFIRNVENLTVLHNHWTWIGSHKGRGVVLRGATHTYELEPAEDLSDVVVEHRNKQRHKLRARAAREYYEIRDRAGAERSGPQIVMESDKGGEVVVA